MASTWFKSVVRAVAIGALTVSTLAVTASAASAETYEVSPGETLSEIARDLGISIDQLMEANGITDPDRVRSGQVLKVPSSTYTVELGDTLFSISQDLGMSFARLAEINDIVDPNRIVEGQVLQTRSSDDDAPAATTPEPAPKAEQANPAPQADGADGRAKHVVVSGESLTSIARQYSVNKARLIEINGLSNADKLAAGDVLILPNWVANKAAVQSVNAPGAESVKAAYPNMPATILRDPARRALIPTFEKWAKENNLPVELVMAVAWQESNWRANAVSSAGAYGIGQIMPDTEKWLVKDVIGDKSLKAKNPHQNIQMSATYLRWLTDYLGTTDLALAGYYQGPGATIREEWADTTDGYVASVKAHRQLFAPAAG